MTVRALFQPFGTEMLSTEVYVRRIDAAEGHGRGDEGYLTLSTAQLESRKGEGRPEVGPHVVPQRQVTQIPDEDVMEVRLDGDVCCEHRRMIFADSILCAEIPVKIQVLWSEKSSLGQIPTIESRKTFRGIVFG
jgi:hypothetical protein